MANNSKGFRIAINKKAILDDVIAGMREDCKKLVKEAFETATFTERTGNLADSYGAAVYVDGKLREETMAYRTIKATETKDWYIRSNIGGHGEMLNFFRDYKPKSKGIAIVLVAAMPYAEVLERGKAKNGAFTLQHKYKVVSGAYSLLQDLAENYNGKRGYKRYKFGRGVRVSITNIG